MMSAPLRDTRADAVVKGEGPDILCKVGMPGVALSIWTRPAAGALFDLLSALDLDGIDDLEFGIDLPVSPDAIAASLSVGGYDDPLTVQMATDIHALASLYAAVGGVTRLTIKLNVVETDACRRFHADYVTYRLITTYRGRATQWAHAGSPDAIDQMEAGQVAIFKGRLLEEEPPILHRSPPIDGTGEQRLLLVIDPATID